MTLKAKELRIGNYLLDRQGRLCEVESIDVAFIDSIVGEAFKAPAILGGLTSLPHNPIPLTEEILLKCGFTKFENKKLGYKSRKWTLEDNSFNLVTDFFYLVYIKQWRGKNKGKRMFEVRRYGHKLVAIESLHQLQNLYFCITNEELTINLN